MQLFQRIGTDGHEEVVYCHDRRVGLRAIVAIHSTALGPSLGGTRFHPYPSEDEALEDVLRLSRAMTYKAAAAGLDQGGGKAVILGDPTTDRTDELILAYGRFVDSLGRRYITAEDVGTTQADMDLIRTVTRHVTGVSQALGGSGDPSAATAYGVLWAMRAVMDHLGRRLPGSHVTVVGVGKVGTALVRHLVEERCRVTVADVSESALARAQSDFGVEVAPPEKAHTVECDILSPCALGGTLNVDTIPELRCAAVVGSANNQLREPADAVRLQHEGVVYAPDYIVNAGGIINIAEETNPAGYDKERAYASVRRIHDTTAAVLREAAAEGISPADTADRLAEHRLAAAATTHVIRTFC